MASDTIRLTASEVEAVATKFSTAATETQDLLTRLQGDVSGMASGWEGDAYNKFTDNFEQIRTKLNDVVELYEGLSEQLKGVVKTLQSADEGLASSMG